MNQAGYTLAEMLVALAAIGLAMGGLTAGVRVVGLNQVAADHAVAQGRKWEAANAALSALLSRQGPFASDDAEPLRGDGQGFAFVCADHAPCSASLTTSNDGEDLIVKGSVLRQPAPVLPVRRAHFVYVGSKTIGGIWPSLSKDPETLRAIALVGEGRDGEVPIATVRLWRDQTADCVFDPISNVCRKAGS